MGWKRWLGVGLTLGAVALAISFGFRPQPVPVETASVVRGPMRVTVEEEAKTRVADRYVVSAPVAGYVRRVRLDVGDRVSAGQTVALVEPMRVAVLDPRSRAEGEARVSAAVATVEARQQEVRAAAANDAYWETQLARIARLNETGDMPRSEYDRAMTEYKRSQATRSAAEHAVDVARSELEAARAALRHSAAEQANSPTSELVPVRAPTSGRVLGVVHKSEGVIQAGAPIVEIANARALEVVVEVLSSDAVRIPPGGRVIFERWGGDAPLEGRVRLIEPVAFTKVSALGVEEQRVRVIVDFTSPGDDWSRLGDGYRLDASFILWEEAEILHAPASAFFRFNGGWAVFTVREGHAQRQPVEIGRRNGLAAQILSGLEEGDTVILHPDDTVEEGKQVKSRT
ncbi:MAG: efflux RND transporter periplasmic adaptor subunit [Bryobacterales bacterium]|nr:efflux RND transporter periplasmic adaptor subunit [Bryobacterales bacterium]